MKRIPLVGFVVLLLSQLGASAETAQKPKRAPLLSPTELSVRLQAFVDKAGKPPFSLDQQRLLSEQAITIYVLNDSKGVVTSLIYIVRGQAKEARSWVQWNETKDGFPVTFASVYQYTSESVSDITRKDGKGVVTIDTGPNVTSGNTVAGSISTSGGSGPDDGIYTPGDLAGLPVELSTSTVITLRPLTLNDVKVWNGRVKLVWLTIKKQTRFYIVDYFQP